MNETTTKSKKPTKICLKCGRGLHSNQEKCSSCGCEDIIDKKEYNNIVEEYERADDTKKLEMRNNSNYEMFFKYNYIQPQKNNIKNTDDKNERNDLLKSLGGLAIIVLAFILLVYITINSNVIIGFIVFAFLIWLGYTIINSISDKTKREVDEINKTKDKQKEYQELHGGYKCPNCGECAGHEISTVKKAVSVGMLGLASNKIGKNYECKNCGYKW